MGMRILICTALFPPDVADPASYIKELSKRLASKHEVTVLAYGAIPESVANVKIVTVSKSIPALWRLLSFSYHLFRIGRRNDTILVENGPSTELPVILTGWLLRKKINLQLSDLKIIYTGYRKLIHQLASAIAKQVIAIPLPNHQPEWLPFTALSLTELSEYEQTWTEHLELLENNL